MGAAGLDVQRYLETKDPMERLAMQAISDEIHERNRVRDQNLAVYITERIGKMLGAK